MGKRITILLSVILATMCVACFPVQENTSSPPGKTDEGTPTLTVWAWNEDFNVYAMQRAADFYREEHPDFRLNVLIYGRPDIVQKMHAALNAGNLASLPDIVPVEDYRIGSFLALYPGCFRDMTDLVDYSRFAEYKQHTMTRNGRKYGIPWDSGTAVMYYRTDLLESAGYTLADVNDITWDTYCTIGRQVSQVTGKYFTVLLQSTLSEFNVYMQSMGVWYTREDGSPYFSGNSALREGIRVYTSLLRDNTALAAMGRSEQVMAVNSGKVASILNGCWFTSAITAAQDQQGLWAMAPPPAFDLPGAGHSSSTGGGSWYVLEGKANADAATQFMLETFGENKALYEALMREKDILATYLPAYESEVCDLPNAYFGNQKTTGFLIEQARNIQKVDYGNHTYEMEAVLQDTLYEVLRGRDIDDALALAQEQAEAWLDSK